MLKLKVCLLETPVPGPSSGKPKQFTEDQFIEEKMMTVPEIIQTVQGIPYYKDVVDDLKNDDHSWEVTQKVEEYAEYLEKNPNTIKDLPPVQVIDGKLDDGAHRISAVYLLMQQDEYWKNVKLRVRFFRS